MDPNHNRRKRIKSASPHTNPGDRKSLDSAPQEWSRIRKGGLINWPESETDERHTESASSSVKEMQNADSVAHLINSNPSTAVQAPQIHTKAENFQQELKCEFLVEEKATNPLSGTMAISLNNNAVNVEPSVNSAGSAVPIPKKTLRLNPKTGTIGSPPNQKASTKKYGASQRATSGKSPKQPRSLLVCVGYGPNGETRVSVGQKINQILGGIATYASLQKTSSPMPEPVVDVKPLKSTHPFFLGKIAPKVVTTKVIEPPQELNAPQAKIGTDRTPMTLGEVKSLAPLKKQAQAVSTASFHSFGTAHKLPKIPGAVDVCWPPHGMIHVRGYDSDKKPSVFDAAAQMSLSTEKKSKYTAAETLAKDDILKIHARNLRINKILTDIQNIDADNFTQPEKCLRVPEKHFESGLHIQRRIRHQLSIRLPLISNLEASTSSEDELRDNQRDQKAVNSALLKVYNGIPTSLTAFDRCQYETQSWIQKYAPCCAAEVLQSGKEPSILKEWLHALTVVSVETGTRDSSQSRGDSLTSRKSATTGAEKASKKKRKSNKLEDFVVSSDEEDSCMDEISDPEGNEFSQRSHIFPKRTVIRSGDVFGSKSRESRKLKNAVVISGPTGCGKTAMVYAVAKELGFEVFEINSSSRRSGKEILEKVGDMTRNHLVHTSDRSDLLPPSDDDVKHVSDALAADLKSGRQGTMNSFFKPGKTHSNTSKSAKTARKNTDAAIALLKTPKGPPKAQKQSLILLEEVDILYEEDKQFWTTVMNLIALSKRPIVMTCNDETVLPMQALTLHAIIRLSPPPVDIAVDYMLLIAAAEGHVLKRKAVKALYEARSCDLRASLTELNYWCQLGVGDRKGGLDWCYPRWPPGCDLDSNGNTIRVVSEGTYKTGMGWLGRDSIFGRLHEPETKEQLLQEVWDGWHIDAGELHDSFGTPSSFDGSWLPVLSYYEDYTEAMSVGDVCAWGSLSTDNQVSLETSSPPVSAKSREDFVIGYELLQADTLSCFDPLHKNISLWMKTQARHLLQSSHPSEVNGISEPGISNHIAKVNRKRDVSIDRTDFSLAFDPIAMPDRISQQMGSGLECSVFDRTISLIAVDVAPFVRSIVAHDVKLQQRRAKLSNLLSEGGKRGKRIRTTRSALSALEGGTRKTTRPEKYFQAELNPYSVQRTGLKYWQDAVASEMEMEPSEEKVIYTVDWDEYSVSGVSNSQ